MRTEQCKSATDPYHKVYASIVTCTAYLLFWNWLKSPSAGATYSQPRSSMPCEGLLAIIQRRTHALIGKTRYVRIGVAVCVYGFNGFQDCMPSILLYMYWPLNYQLYQENVTLTMARSVVWVIHFLQLTMHKEALKYICGPLCLLHTTHWTSEARPECERHIVTHTTWL